MTEAKKPTPSLKKQMWAPKRYKFPRNLNRKNATSKPKTLPKASKNNFQFFFNSKLNRIKATSKTKILPKTRKNNFASFFYLDLNRTKSSAIN